MIDKIAVPFWLCWTAGMLIGLETGNVRLWLILGAVAGIGMGIVAAAVAVRRKQRVFQGTGLATIEPRQAPTAQNAPEQKRAA